MNVLNILSDGSALAKSEIMFFDENRDDGGLYSKSRARFLRIKDCLTYGLAETIVDEDRMLIRITDLGKQVCEDLTNLAEPISFKDDF